MNDQELITAVRQSVQGVRMNIPAEQIVSRSRAIRASGHRRLAACITAVAAAGSVVLGVGLAGAFGSAPARGTGTIRTAAFTLVEHADGTATLTFNMNLLQDPGALRRALRQDGIPAIVRADSFCSSDPIPAGFAQVVSGLAAPYSTGPAPAAASFTINPAAMPAGTELSFGFFLPWNSRIGAIIELIDTNSYTCSSTAPLAPAYGEGYAAEYARPAQP
jgi:hypothetical protein